MDATRERASMTSRDAFAALVARLKALFDEGDFETIWSERCRFGISVGEDQLEADDWFWFNAYPALAGLRLRKMPGFPLDNFCGLADNSVSYGDAAQVSARDEINRLYFGS